MRRHRGSPDIDAARPVGQPPGVAIVDYGVGNRRSVEKALERVGARPVLTADHDTLAAADGLVVPGVGAFVTAMTRLRAAGLDELIATRAQGGTPVLGLCLGMQLLFERSDELGGDEGLGLLAGHVRALSVGAGLKVPHIGWNEVRFAASSPLTDGLGGSAAFYHVHSFAVDPEDPADVLGSGDYGGPFVSIVARDSVFGAQFHPEKSSFAGLRLLRNFAGICARVRV